MAAEHHHHPKNSDHSGWDEVAVALHSTGYVPKFTNTLPSMLHIKPVAAEAQPTCAFAMPHASGLQSASVYVSQSSFADSAAFVTVFVTNSSSAAGAASRQLLARCGGPYPFAARDSVTGRRVFGQSDACESLVLCVEIANMHGEDIGLAFIGRGFDMEIKVPFNRSLDEGLRKSAAECVAACPTAAIAFRNKEDMENCHTTVWIEL